MFIFQYNWNLFLGNIAIYQSLNQNELISAYAWVTQAFSRHHGIWGVVLFEDFLCQKQVSRAGKSTYTSQYLWDVITCTCRWYLLLEHMSSFQVYRMISTLILTSEKICKHLVKGWILETENIIYPYYGPFGKANKCLTLKFPVSYPELVITVPIDDPTLSDDYKVRYIHIHVCVFRSLCEY